MVVPDIFSNLNYPLFLCASVIVCLICEYSAAYYNKTLILSILQENWVPQGEAISSTEMFDVIVCLSVTKWVHLNWGDCGIKKLFKKVS